jgi:hypothetical protein
MFVNVWKDDYERFQDWLVVGNMVAMRVRPPSGGFNTLTFDSVPKHMRKKLPPKEDDYRLILLKRPPEKPKPVKQEDDLDSMIFNPDQFVIAEPKRQMTPEEQQEEFEVGLAEANMLQDYYEGEAELDNTEE